MEKILILIDIEITININDYSLIKNIEPPKLNLKGNFFKNWKSIWNKE